MMKNILVKGFATAVLPTIMFLFCVTGAFASNVVFHLHCDKTTEAGEDEVYYLVNTLKSDGNGYASRLPGENSHWNMNDGNKLPDVQNVVLSDFNLSEGQSAKIVVNIMEEDGGSVFGWLDFAKGVDERGRKNGISNPIPVDQIVNLVKSFIPFDIEDSDDWIGSFEVTVTKRNGNLVAQWNAISRSQYLGQSSGPQSNGFRFNGDGTNYYGWGQLNP